MQTAYQLLEEELATLKSEYTALTTYIPRNESPAQAVYRHFLNGRISGIKCALGIIETSQQNIVSDIKEWA